MVTPRITAWLNEPLVPAMVALYSPAGRPAPHVGNWFAEPPAGTKTVAVFVSVVNQHAKAVEDVVMTRLTLPEKPLRLVSVIIVCLSEATGMAWKVGLSAMVKSPDAELVTVTAMLVLCDIEPFDPVKIAVYVPRAVEDVVDTVRTEVPVPPDVRVMVAEARLTVSPAGTETDRVTVPVKPLRLVRVAVEVAEVPCATPRVLGLTVREKSGIGEGLTVTEIATE